MKRSIKREIVINTSKDRVWDVLFYQFGHVNDFNPLIEASQPTGEIQGEIGAERTCDITPKSKVHERISSVRGTESFDIEILEGGLPMMDKIDATWDVKKMDEERTKVVLHFNYSTKPAFMGILLKVPMSRQLQGMLVGLKYFLETGGQVTKKNIKQIVRDFKDLNQGGSFSTILDLGKAA